MSSFFSKKKKEMVGYNERHTFLIGNWNILIGDNNIILIPAGSLHGDLF